MKVLGRVKIIHTHTIMPKDKAMKAVTNGWRTGLMHKIMSNSGEGGTC
jgi:hypothetical protein